MRTLEEVSAGLKHGATAARAARLARDIAADADKATLLEIVSMLVDAVVTPPKRVRGGQLKPPQSVTERTAGHVALSEYAHIVNARNIADGRKPAFAHYGVGMSKQEAIQYLKDRRLYAHGRQGIKARAKSYALRKVSRLWNITTDEFDRLRREKLSTN